MEVVALLRDQVVFNPRKGGLVLQQKLVQDVSASAQILRDIQCSKCTYDLRGLQQDGMCPECRTPVAHSLANEAFWLLRIRMSWLKREH